MVCKSNKKGQITIFVIVAVILVAAVGTVFFVANSSKQPASSAPAEIPDIETYVEDCLEKNIENGLTHIGRQGGYYSFISEPSYSYSGSDSEPGILATTFSDLKIGYYFKDSMNLMPSIETIENQLSLYVEDNMGECLNDFQVFKQIGFQIQLGDMSASSFIFEDRIRVSLDYPITINKGDSTQRFSKYSAEIPSRLNLIYNLTKTFISQQVASPSNICMTCLMDYKDNGFYTQLMIVDDNTALFVITDTEGKLNNTYYDFVFANQY